MSRVYPTFCLPAVMVLTTAPLKQNNNNNDNFNNLFIPPLLVILNTVTNIISDSCVEAKVRTIDLTPDLLIVCTDLDCIGDELCCLLLGH